MDDDLPISGAVIFDKIIKTENVTPSLRFIERDGRRILQQAWLWHSQLSHGYEWRDVPLVTE